MNLSDFDYTLPKSLIAQEPSKKRSDSRLLVYDREKDSIHHTQFKAIGDYLPKATQFFRNEVSVLKARLFGRRQSGGFVECLLLNPAEATHTWWCLIKPGKKTFKAGFFSDDTHYRAEVLEASPQGEYKVRFELYHEADVYALAQKLGKMPLPPYIQRALEDERDALDAERYQTVYADAEKPFAAAAPTAGLHFSQKLIEQLKSQGHSFYNLCLNVGIGTFQPIQVDTIEDHSIHTESFSIGTETLQALESADNPFRIAVGTTSLRAIESYARAAQNNPALATAKDSFTAQTDLYIYPPAPFYKTNALLTNFHLPRSSLLCLVAAYLSPDTTNGIDLLKNLYKEAIKNKYRFYSYGDAMLLL